MYLFLAQAEQRPPTLFSLMPIVLIFVISYFLIIKPQKQKQQEHQKMDSSLKKNDDVVTIGGIYGTVANVKEQSVVLRIADNIKIEVQKNAIAGLKKSKPDVTEDGVRHQQGI